jgi:mono/diheme cytochrome c family protein
VDFRAAAAVNWRTLISALLAAVAASACALPPEPAAAPASIPATKAESTLRIEATPKVEPAVKVAPAAEPGPTAEAGHKIYTSFCVRCHGVNLAVSSPAFFDLRTFPKDEKERFVHSVSMGKRAMPAWGSIVKPVEIDALWKYIGSVNGWKADAADSDRSGVNKVK